MLWLGLLVAVAFVPGVTGASIPTQWAVLSILLPFALWRKAEMTFLHWVGAAFLSYAFVSYAWANDPLDGILGLWQLSIVALAFWLGSTMTSLRSIYIGLAIGLTLSSALAVAQYLGYDPIPKGKGYPGLYYNTMIHGEVLALVIIGLLAERLWLLIPGLLPGMVLSQSRGAWLALSVGALLVFFRQPLIAIIVGLACLYAFTYNISLSDFERIQVWSVAIDGATWFGHGPGAFLGVFRQGHTVTTRLEYAHNDFLQLAFEFGIGATLLYVVYLCALSRTSASEWPVLCAFLLMALFSFPLYAPVTAFIGAMATGRLARDWGVAWSGFNRSRLSFV